MKKLFALLTIACMSLGANAQVYVGIKGGGGISVLTAGGTYAHNPGIGFNGGLAYKQQVFKRMILEGDILMDIRETIVPDLNNAGLTSTYIAVPITAQYIMPFNKQKLVPYRTDDFKTFWFIEGGPQLGYALDAITYLDPSSDANADDVQAGGFDVGVVAGIGINFAFKHSRNRLVVGARGHYGLLNYNNYETAPTFNNITAGGYISYDIKWTKKTQYRYRW